jgi:hypothetical protein
VDTRRGTRFIGQYHRNSGSSNSIVSSVMRHVVSDVLMPTFVFGCAQ